MLVLLPRIYFWWSGWHVCRDTRRHLGRIDIFGIMCIRAEWATKRAEEAENRQKRQQTVRIPDCMAEQCKCQEGKAAAAGRLQSIRGMIVHRLVFFFRLVHSICLAIILAARPHVYDIGISFTSLPCHFSCARFRVRFHSFGAVVECCFFFIVGVFVSSCIHARVSVYSRTLVHGTVMWWLIFHCVHSQLRWIVYLLLRRSNSS